MTTLTVTNEKGTTFNYAKDGEFTVITVTKNNNSNEYKTYSKNSIKEGKLSVCRVDGSWVDMPVSEPAKVADFMKGREKVCFNSVDEYRTFESNNSVGKFFNEGDKFVAYKYL